MKFCFAFMLFLLTTSIVASQDLRLAPGICCACAIAKGDKIEIAEGSTIKHQVEGSQGGMPPGARRRASQAQRKASPTPLRPTGAKEEPSVAQGLSRVSGEAGRRGYRRALVRRTICEKTWALSGCSCIAFEHTRLWRRT